MDFLNGKIKTLYFKYLAAAFGSALITSIYSIVDMAMVGQYHGPEGAAALAVVAPVWNIIYSMGLLMGIGGGGPFLLVRGGGGGGGPPPKAAGPRRADRLGAQSTSVRLSPDEERAGGALAQGKNRFFRHSAWRLLPRRSKERLFLYHLPSLPRMDEGRKSSAS